MPTCLRGQEGIRPATIGWRYIQIYGTKFSHSTEENISGGMKNSKIDTSHITLHVVLGERKVFLEPRILVSLCFFGGHNALFLTNAQHSKLETTDLNGDHFLLGQQAAY